MGAGLATRASASASAASDSAASSSRCRGGQRVSENSLEGKRRKRTHLFRSEDRHLSQHLANLLHRLLNILHRIAVLSNNPQRSTEHLATLDLPKRLQQLLDDTTPERWELFNDLANESDNIDGRGIGGVAEEFHEDVDDVRGDFRVLDGAGVDRLNEKLAVLGVLSAREDGVSDLVPSQAAIIQRQTRLAFSNCPSNVLTNSFFKNPTTSSTFLLETISSAIARAFLRTSISGLARTRRMSMTRSSRTCSCFE